MSSDPDGKMCMTMDKDFWYCFFFIVLDVAEKLQSDVYQFELKVLNGCSLSVNFSWATLIYVNNIICLAGSYENDILTNKVWKLEF